MDGPELGERLPWVSDEARDIATGLPIRRAGKSGEETEVNADVDDVIVGVEVSVLRGISTGGRPNGETENLLECEWYPISLGFM